MSETTKQERREIQDLLDSLEESGWIVRDYDPTVDPNESLSVDVSLERQDTEELQDFGTSKEQRDRITGVKEVIERLSENTEHGAPTTEVIRKTADELDANPSFIKHEITRLKEKGEIYEPKADHLRVT